MKRKKKFKNLTSNSPKVRKRRVRLFFKKLLTVKFLTALVLLITIICSLMIIKAGIFNIQRVEVLGVSNCASPQEIITTSGILGKMFFGLEVDQSKTALQSRYLCLKDVKVEKSLIGQTKIHVTSRTPTLVVKNLPRKERLFLNELEASSSSETAQLFALDYSVNESANEFLLVDQEGYIYDVPPDSLGLPVVHIEGQELRLGGKIPSDQVQSTSFVLSKLPEFGINVQSSKIVGDNFLVEAHPKLVFSLTKDIKTQIASLQLILSKATMNLDSLNSSEEKEQSNLESVDLRFEKAVVVYSPKSK